MFLPDQSDGVVMDSLVRGNEAQLVAGALRFFREVWDTEKAGLLKL